MYANRVFGKKREKKRFKEDKEISKEK